MVQFEVRFDSGNEFRNPTWVVIRFNELGSPNARFGERIAEFASQELANRAAKELNRGFHVAKFTLPSNLVVE